MCDMLFFGRDELTFWPLFQFQQVPVQDQIFERFTIDQLICRILTE